MIIGKSAKYPKDGPHLTQGENIKFNKYLEEYKMNKVDSFVTNEILQKLSENNLNEACAIILFNFKRVGFGPIANSYRKIPRDALRVGVLSMTSRINEMLTKKDENAA